MFAGLRQEAERPDERESEGEGADQPLLRPVEEQVRVYYIISYVTAVLYDRMYYFGRQISY